MRHKFIKNGKVYIFKTTMDKVITTIIVDGHFVINPTLEQFLQDGWELVVESEPEISEPVVTEQETDDTPTEENEQVEENID